MKSVSSSRKLFPVVAAPKVSAGERSEPKRAVGAGTTAALAQPAGPPLVVAGNSEVVAKASRRRFTVDYKLKILDQADACHQAGELGALLRREGLYSSSLALWRHQRQQGILSGLTPRTRGRKPNRQSQLVADNEQLKRQNQKLSKRLQQAEIIIEFQKKLAEALGIPLKGDSIE
jgi:transposase-like protein